MRGHIQSKVLTMSSACASCCAAHCRSIKLSIISTPRFVIEITDGRPGGGPHLRGHKTPNKTMQPHMLMLSNLPGMQASGRMTARTMWWFWSSPTTRCTPLHTCPPCCLAYQRRSLHRARKGRSEWRVLGKRGLICPTFEAREPALQLQGHHTLLGVSEAKGRRGVGGGGEGDYWPLLAGRNSVEGLEEPSHPRGW